MTLEVAIVLAALLLLGTLAGRYGADSRPGLDDQPGQAWPFVHRHG